MIIFTYLEDALAFLFKSPLWILAVVLKISLVTRLLLKWNFPLSQVPGPRLAAWTRFWWLKTLYRGNVAAELVQLEKDHGPLVRIAPNSVIVSDPEVTRKILAVGSKYTRGPWFDSLRLHPSRTNVVSEREPKRHQQLRSILGVGLSGKDANIEPKIQGHVKEWMNLLLSKYPQKNAELELDLSQDLSFLTFDIIADLCLGETFHCLEKGTDPYGFLGALKTGVVAQQYISSLLEIKNVLFFLAKIPVIGGRIFPNLNDKTGIGRVMHVIHEIVERRTLETENLKSIKGDMLDSFLSRGLTIDQASSELLIVLTSGIGSTSYAAQAIICCIMGNTDVYQRLQNEIDNATNQAKLKAGKRVNYSTLNQMPYFQACKSEALRLYPPITLLRERQVPADGDVINGYYLPGGTFMGLNSLATQLHPIYGDDRETFKPERWLINDTSVLKEMYHTLELVFGYGASKCLGVNVADMELDIIIFELFKNFTVSFANPELPWEASGGLISSDSHVKLKRRNVSADRQNHI